MLLTLARLSPLCSMELWRLFLLLLKLHDFAMALSSLWRYYRHSPFQLAAILTNMLPFKTLHARCAWHMTVAVRAADEMCSNKILSGTVDCL